jgi:hypothetical protein
MRTAESWQRIGFVSSAQRLLKVKNADVIHDDSRNLERVARGGAPHGRTMLARIKSGRVGRKVWTRCRKSFVPSI